MTGLSHFTQPNLTAGGNVSPMRFLKFDGTNFHRAIQATGVTVPLIGISERNTRYTPGSPSDDGFIAIVDEMLPYRGPMQMASLTLGGSITTQNTPLTSDGSGKGIAQAPADGTTAWYGAFAMASGSADQVITVYILPPTPTV